MPFLYLLFQKALAHTGSEFRGHAGKRKQLPFATRISFDGDSLKTLLSRTDY